MEALRCVTIRNRPYVAVHAKNFLDQNNGSACRTGALGDVSLKLVSIFGRDDFVPILIYDLRFGGFPPLKSFVLSRYAATVSSYPILLAFGCIQHLRHEIH